MPNADGKGCQINLDNGEGRIIAGYVVDDIRAISSYLDITFESPKKLLFGADNHYYFTYLKIDWVPASFDENTGLNKTWHYSIRALPKPLYEYITKPCKNTSELARTLKLNLSELSVNLDLPCPIINQYAGNIIQASRFYSLEKAYNDRQLNKAVFIYLNSRELYSATWRSLTSQTAVALTFPEGTEGTNLITYQDYQFENVFNTAHGCNVWKQKDYLGKMLGTQFKVNTTVPAVCLNTYTIKSEEIPDFDTGLSFLCTYSKRDIMEVNAFTHCFTNINYM